MSYISFEKNEDNNELSVTIETDRLRLESVNLQDRVYDYYALFSNPVSIASYDYGIPWSLQETTDSVTLWNARWRNNDPFSAFAITEIDTEKFIGQTALGYGEFIAGQAELSYIFDHKNWGMGYGTEAASAMVHEYAPELVRRDYTVNGDKFSSIMATVRDDNPASLKILSKVGMKYVGERVKTGHNRYFFFLPLDPLDLLDEQNRSQTEEHSVIRWQKIDNKLI